MVEPSAAAGVEEEATAAVTAASSVEAVAEGPVDGAATARPDVHGGGAFARASVVGGGEGASAPEPTSCAGGVRAAPMAGTCAAAPSRPAAALRWQGSGLDCGEEPEREGEEAGEGAAGAGGAAPEGTRVGEP